MNGIIILALLVLVPTSWGQSVERMRIAALSLKLKNGEIAAEVRDALVANGFHRPAELLVVLNQYSDGPWNCGPATWHDKNNAWSYTCMTKKDEAGLNLYFTAKRGESRQLQVNTLDSAEFIFGNRKVMGSIDVGSPKKCVEFREARTRLEKDYESTAKEFYECIPF
jgi:hypothetical protein